MCNQFQVTWLHPSQFAEACNINKNMGFMHQNLGWLKRLYRSEGVFSMAINGHCGHIIGWSTYQRTTSGIEMLWLIVREEERQQGFGARMIDRMKSWLPAVPDRRGAITCSVNEYADDLLYFLRSHGFECLNINPEKRTYRMCFIAEAMAKEPKKSQRYDKYDSR